MAKLNKKQHVYLAIGKELTYLGPTKNRNSISNANEAAVVAWSNEENAGDGETSLEYDNYENIAFLGPRSPHTIIFLDHKL